MTEMFALRFQFVNVLLATFSNSWNDLNCDAVRNWICKIPKGKVPSNPPANPPPQGTEDTQCGTDTTWVSGGMKQVSSAQTLRSFNAQVLKIACNIKPYD